MQRKATTAERLAIDISSWRRADLLNNDLSFESRWRLDTGAQATLRVSKLDDGFLFDHSAMSSTGAWAYRSYRIHLTMTAGGFGGKRAWFICPAESCRRRSAVLYADPHIPIFICRVCAQLVYPSQREDPLARGVRRIIKIRDVSP